MRVPDMLLRSSDVTARAQLHWAWKAKVVLLMRALSLQISTTVWSLQTVMGRELRPMGKLLLRVTVRVQTKGQYRMLCLSFRMLLVEGTGLCSLTRACM